MPQSNDPTIVKASAALAAALGLAPADVTLGVGDDKNDYSSTPKTTTLHLVIRKPGIDIDQATEEKAILAGLDTLAPISAIAQTAPEETLAAKTLEDIKTVAEGTSFNQALLDWPGFNPEIATKRWSVDDHALTDIDSTAYGVEFRIHVPTDKDTDRTAAIETVANNLKERQDAIRDELGKRLEKYTRANAKDAGKSDEEIEAIVAKAREDFARVEMHINASTERSGINITLRTPEQAEAFKEAPNTYKVPDNADALRAGNPLNALSDTVTEAEKENHASPQLHKALSRAFLFAGDKAMDVFPTIAGRQDIRRAIAKELRKIEKDHPDKAEAANAALESSVFKNHDMFSDGAKDEAAPAKPTFIKNPDEPDTLHAVITLDKDKVRPTLEALAGESQAQETGTASETVEGGIAERLKSSGRGLADILAKPISDVKMPWTQRTQTPSQGATPPLP